MDEELYREKGYEVDAACAGAYFRVGKYLNIPNPGIAYSGDPNLSVYITQEMKGALQELFEIPARKTA